MTAMERYERIEQLDILIRAREKQIAALRDALLPGAAPADAERVSHTRDVHAMESRIAAVVDAEREMDALAAERAGLQRELIGAINRLSDPREIMLMTERCVEGKSTAEIAEAHGYSRRWVEKIVKGAAERMDGIS